MNDHIDPAIVEAAARSGFAAAAANAAKHYGLNKPVTWDEHLTDDDREHELGRSRAALSAAAPLIAAKALREAAEAQLSYAWQPGDGRTPPKGMESAYMIGADDAHAVVDRLLRARADALEAGQS